VRFKHPRTKRGGERRSDSGFLKGSHVKQSFPATLPNYDYTTAGSYIEIGFLPIQHFASAT
jgi:hypothetical protein